jgi:hypothetical protein
MTTAPRTVTAAYIWFVGAAAVWALAVQMNQMVFSWLLVGELQESAGWVGTAQMCQQLPFLVFLLLGGLVADRVELRGLLTGLYVLGALTIGVLAALVAAGRASLPVLLPYALCWGAIQAFVGPSRDAMVSHVVSGSLLRAITGITLVQFLCLALGAQLGGFTEIIGSGANLALQAGVVLLGVVAVRQLPRVATQERPAGAGALTGWRSGLVEVWRSSELRPIALLVGANGLFFMGPFQVLGPLIVRNVYHGGAADLALHWMLLPLGTISGSLGMLALGRKLKRGPAFVTALVGVCLCLIAIAARPPFWGYLALIFLWGVFHAMFFNTSRALFQELASGAHRARILSVHSLGLLGMAPLSNLASGLVADVVGPTTGCLVAGATMLAVVGAALAVTPVRNLQ